MGSEPPKSLEPWRNDPATVALDTPIFRITRRTARPPGQQRGFERYVIEAPDWCNVIALTDDERVVMIRQYRAGRDEITLEIPGGMVDPGEDPRTAAARELREETGFVAADVVPIGEIAPNPAIQNNRCFSFFATKLRREQPDPEDGEDIAVELMPLDQAREAARSGLVTHSLVVVAFHFFEAYIGRR